MRDQLNEKQRIPITDSIIIGVSFSTNLLPVNRKPS